MTVTEMVTDFRDQIQEYVESFYGDTDILRYLRKGLYHFTKRTNALLHRDLFTIYPERIGDTPLPEIVDVTFVDDLTSTTGTIQDQYFILYDGSDAAHVFWFNISGGTAPTGFTNVYEITITADQGAAAIASTALGVINGATNAAGNLAFNAVINGSIVTVTNNTNGWINNTSQNNNVNNGTSALAIAIVQTGVNDSYPLTYRFSKSRGATLKYPESNNSYSRDRFYDLYRVAWQDWYAMTNDYRESNMVYYIDISQNALYVAPTYQAGEISIEYHLLPSDSNWQTLINNSILEEEYHDAIVDYALYLALRKDREMQLANFYLSSYLDNEKRAIEAIDEKLQKPRLDDWSDADTRYHRPQDGDTRQGSYIE